MGGVQHAEDPQALLEPDPVVAHRSREHDVRQTLDPAPQRHRGLGVTGLPGGDHVHLLARHDRPEADERARRAQQERLQDEVVVAGQQRDLSRQLLEQPGRVDEAPGVERRFLDRDDAVHRRHRLERVGLEVHPGQGRLQLEEDERQADVRDGLVIGDRHARVQRLAQVGRDREHEQRVCAGRSEVASLAHGRIGGGTRQTRHDRDVRHVADDLEDADLLVVGQMRPLAGVHVDREGDRSLRHDPADIGAQGRLIDATVRVHGQHGGGDQAVEVQCHGALRGVVGAGPVTVYYRTPEGHVGVEADPSSATAPRRYAIIDENLKGARWPDSTTSAWTASSPCIPGGGGGIGSALAVALAGAGANVVVGGRTQESLDATVAQVKAAGGEGLAVVADATDEADAERLVAKAVERFGRLDILVNAVGGGAGKVLHDAEIYPRSDWDWIMELNVRSTVVADAGRGAPDDRPGRWRRGS